MISQVIFPPVSGSGQCIKKSENSSVRCLHEVRYKLDPTDVNSEEVVTKSFDRCYLEGDYENFETEQCSDGQVCEMEIDLFDIKDDLKLREIYFNPDGIRVPVVSMGCVNSTTELDETRAHSCQQINGDIESQEAINFFKKKTAKLCQ